LGDWGIGDWALGIGPNPQSPIPNPQSPIPNPQLKLKLNSKLMNKLIYIFNYLKLLYIIYHN